MKETYIWDPFDKDPNIVSVTLLEDAIGEIDEDMIQAVDQLRQLRDENSHTSISPDPSTVVTSSKTSRLRPVSWKKVAAWGSMAACLCLFVGVRSLWSLKSADSAPAEAIKDAADSYYSGQDSAREEMEIVLENQSIHTPSTDEETLPVMTYVLPSLYLHIEDQVVPAWSGTHCWTISQEDDVVMQVQSDSYHPLELQESLPMIQTSTATLILTFDDTYGTPESVTVQCWDDTCWGNPMASPRSISIDGNQITLLEGPYIYQISTWWEAGTIQYSFYANFVPQE